VVWPLEPCAAEIPEPPEEPELDAELEPPEDVEPDDVAPLEPEPLAAALPVPPDVEPLAVLVCGDPGRT